MIYDPTERLDAMEEAERVHDREFWEMYHAASLQEQELLDRLTGMDKEKLNKIKECYYAK